MGEGIFMQLSRTAKKKRGPRLGSRALDNHLTGRRNLAPAGPVGKSNRLPSPSTRPSTRRSTARREGTDGQGNGTCSLRTPATDSSFARRLEGQGPPGRSTEAVVPPLFRG